MSYESRTIREAGVGEKVTTVAGHYVEIIHALHGGWFQCRTPEGITHELHGSCLLMSVEQKGKS
jgi:hypothetical protein